MNQDDPLKLVPVNFGVKFNPPKLGLEYYKRENPKIQLIYEIALQPLLEQKLVIEELVTKVFEQNKVYLHPRVISRTQVKRLIEKVLSKQQNQKENKKNSKAIDPILVLNDIKKQNLNQDAAWKQWEDESEKSSLQLNQYQSTPNDRSAVQSEDASQLDNSVVINPDNIDDMELDLEINQVDFPNKFHQNKNFLAGAHLGKSNALHESEEPSLHMSMKEDLEEGESDYLQEDEGVAISDRQFPQESGDENQEIDDQDDLGEPSQNFDMIEGEDGEEEDVIDIDNPEDLARRGLKRINIEGEQDEFLLDGAGRIYNLQGECVGSMDGDIEEGEDN